MNKVINLQQNKSKEETSKETSSDSTFAEIMKRNEERKKKIEQEKLQRAQEIASQLKRGTHHDRTIW